MDQEKIGSFLKKLRKEKRLTQEQLAEEFNVAGRTVSRWETGNNMPDLSLLVKIADYYDVDIREVINGERKSKKMDNEIRDTLVKVAGYGDVVKKSETGKLHQFIGAILAGFGAFIIISSFAVFPSDSSWGSIYSVIGCVIASIGIYKLCAVIKITKKPQRIICTIGCFLLMLCCLHGLDYMSVKAYKQPPRFCYEKSYGEDVIEYKTLFYTVTRYNVDADDEYYEFN
ncbi:MAG TPA: helix-turn-helix transcriptional regulator [Bacillota bacterium]|nr:helix-turn-helix transcriptional regulator [Bacillota bacterium]